jgi:hypothetical protein
MQTVTYEGDPLLRVKRHRGTMPVILIPAHMMELKLPLVLMSERRRTRLTDVVNSSSSVTAKPA